MIGYEPKTGDLVYVTNAAFDRRNTKYAVIIDPVSQGLLFINTPKKNKKTGKTDGYKRHFQCLEIRHRKYPFLNKEEGCITGRNHIEYNRYEDGSIINTIDSIEDTLDLMDLRRLRKHISSSTEFKIEAKQPMCDCITKRIIELNRQQAAMRQMPAFFAACSNLMRQQQLMSCFGWWVNQAIHHQFLHRCANY